MAALSTANAKRLFDLFGLNHPVKCLDVGAMALESKDPWTLYAQTGCTEVLGFEPNHEECLKLQQQTLTNHTFLPVAVGNGSEMPLYVTNTGMTSSLLEPDLVTMGLFPNLAELCQVVNTPLLATRRLDDLAEAQYADFLKLDIQGGELMALLHAKRTLESIVVLQTEIEFLEIYKGQPLFADVDSFLRSHGFMFHHFAYLSGRPYKVPKQHSIGRQGSSQVLWGDAIYIRDQRYIDKISTDKLLNMAYIMACFYEANDLAIRLLSEVDNRVGSDYSYQFINQIRAWQEHTELAQHVAASDRKHVALPLANGLQVVVPNRLDLITPYVIAEQGHWFEDEYPFVRKLLKEGDHTLDIGANYGLYSLVMGQAVGPSGSVHAFEPASSTADVLRHSLKLNGLTETVKVYQMALSHEPGKGRLGLETNAELNTLLNSNGDDSNHSMSEEVSIESLDHLFVEEDSLPPITFMKVDAEGQESAILTGGQVFFKRHSPLVMFEVKEGNDFHNHLIADFQAIGYSCFRLVPGLHLLSPVSPMADLDPYILNLFACKRDKQVELEKEQKLVNQTPATAEPLPGILVETNLSDLIDLPYVKLLNDLWSQHPSNNREAPVGKAIRLFLASQLSQLSASSRLAYLERSYHLLQEILELDSNYLRLATFARIAMALGQRAEAVKALTQLAERIQAAGNVDLREPFLLPCMRYETIKPSQDKIGQFVYAATLEELNNAASYSSFYTPKPALNRLTLIQQLGFADSRVTTTINLINRRLAGAREIQG